MPGISAHLTSPPFQYQQLQHDYIHNILSSYDVMGGPHTFNSVWARESFRENNPKTYAAFLAALNEAMEIINADKPAAAETYIRVTGSGLDQAFIQSIVEDPDITFTTTPLNTMKFAEFMHSIDVLKNKPESVQGLLLRGRSRPAGQLILNDHASLARDTVKGEAAAGPASPLLEVDGVTLQYKTKDHLVTATYRVSFQVFGADRFVLFGPVRLRQVHAAQGRGWLHGPGRGRDAAQRQCRSRSRP